VANSGELIMRKLDGKIAVITGGAMGMGYGSASIMAGYGGEIALIDYSDTVFKAADSLTKRGTPWKKLSMKSQPITVKSIYW
jgi:NAD(P)-dependent dehydrogenase (short-subunit alcohol dehydrogenase family)